MSEEEKYRQQELRHALYRLDCSHHRFGCALHEFTEQVRQLGAMIERLQESR